MADNDEISVTKESLWYIDNYVLIRIIMTVQYRELRLGVSVWETLPWRIILFTLILLMS